MFNAEKVKNELIQWIGDYFEKNGQNSCAVVGISGGKDSSVVAALCARALGRERVVGVLMPQGVQQDIDVSRALVAYLDIRSFTVNIGETVGVLFKAIEDSGADMSRQAEINTPARVRMATLYAVAAGLNGRVSNNCNLSETWVGYSTKYGDAAGDFSPLSSLTVTEVKAIGRALDLPEMFVEKVPIDGLCGKTDEENLGFTYALLDNYIRTGQCDGEAVKAEIDRLHVFSAHKRTEMPRFKYQADVD